MATGIASGLGATWGVTKEGTVGTFTTTSMRWIPVVTDKVIGNKKTVTSQALHGGLYELANLRALTFLEAKGAIELELRTRQAGLLLEAMIGSSPTLVPITGGTWTVTITGSPTGGNFTLSFGSGNTTGNIAYNATAGTVQTAVQALSGQGSATVAGSAGGPYTITGLTVPGILTANGAGLTGGSSPAATAAATTGGAGYGQVHQPGDLTGTSYSLQSGRPQTNGTIQQFNYGGAKITDWELSCQTGELAKLMATWDAWSENTSTAYATPAYVVTNNNPFNFTQGAFVTSASAATIPYGVAQINSGAAPTGIVKKVSIKGQNPLDTTRQPIGSTTKKEQLANNFRKYTGTAEVEFANLTDLYNAYNADTQTSLQLTFTSGVNIPTTSVPFSIQVLCPAVFFNGAPPDTDGPHVLTQKVTFDILDDGVTTPIQFYYVSQDTAV